MNCGIYLVLAPCFVLPRIGFAQFVTNIDSGELFLIIRSYTFLNTILNNEARNEFKQQEKTHV